MIKRRSAMSNDSLKAFIKKHGIRLAAAAAIAAVGTSAYLITREKSDPAPVQKQQSETLTEAESAVRSDEPEIKPSPEISPLPEFGFISVSEVNETIDSIENVSATEAPAAPMASSVPARRAGSEKLTMPIASGVITQAYSGDEFVYFTTLKTWMTHNGADISGKSGSEVLSALAGTVSSVREDAAKGTVIEIDHGNGIRTVYAGLLEVRVKEGDKVGKGSVIGLLGVPPFEASLGAHLHFEYIKDGEYLDPAELF